MLDKLLRSGRLSRLEGRRPRGLIRDGAEPALARLPGCSTFNPSGRGRQYHKPENAPGL